MTASSPCTDPAPRPRPEPAPRRSDSVQRQASAANRELAAATPQQVVDWAVDHFGDGLVMSTSFGIHSAAFLHLVTRVVPRIPVLWIDTGYLPPETYRFAEALRERLQLDLRPVQAAISPAHMEAIHGRLWESEVAADHDRYLRIRKVEPMQRALRDLDARAWLAGVRSDQTAHRQQMPRISEQWGRVKIAPILRWSTRDVFAYLREHDLPLHPFFERGYASVGDWHSSRPVSSADDDVRATRFGGRREECGLHLDDDQAESLESSRL